MTPWPARVAAGCAVAYVFSPIQLIPTFIPLIGQLDDLLVVYAGAKLVRRLTPNSVLAECEARAQSAVSWQQTKWDQILGAAKQRLSPTQRRFPSYRGFRQLALNQVIAVRTKVTKPRLWVTFSRREISPDSTTNELCDLSAHAAFEDKEASGPPILQPNCKQ